MAQGWWPAISPSIDDLQCTSTSNSRAGTDGVKRVVGKADLNKWMLSRIARGITSEFKWRNWSPWEYFKSVEQRANKRQFDMLPECTYFITVRLRRVIAPLFFRDVEQIGRRARQWQPQICHSNLQLPRNNKLNGKSEITTHFQSIIIRNYSTIVLFETRIEFEKIRLSLLYTRGNALTNMVVWWLLTADCRMVQPTIRSAIQLLFLISYN